MKTIRTTCPYCGVGCGVLASVDDAGRTDGRGSPGADRRRARSPAPRRPRSPAPRSLRRSRGLAGRLLTPEVDGQQVAWPQALAETAARLRQIIDQHGPQAVAFYALAVRAGR